MSLINDALKRADEAQQKSEQGSPPELKFRGIDPREAKPKGLNWVLPSVITACVVVGVVAIWEARSGRGTTADKNAGRSGELKVHAREQEATDSAQSGKVAVVGLSGTTIQETTKGGITNAPASTEAAPAKQAAKLQGIIFNPARPSATINGKTVFVGERVGDWKVIAIDKESATVVGGGATNVLTLGE